MILDNPRIVWYTTGHMSERQPIQITEASEVKKPQVGFDNWIRQGTSTVLITAGIYQTALENPDFDLTKGFPWITAAIIGLVLQWGMVFKADNLEVENQKLKIELAEKSPETK